MGPEANAGLLAPSDIAELAGVTRAAVSNWRKRRPDFPPAAAGTVAKPLFDRTDVEQWLVANGHQILRDSREVAVWALINRFREELPLQATRELVHAVLCARKLGDEADLMDDLNDAASHGQILDALQQTAARPDADPRWRELVTDDLDSCIERYGIREHARPVIDQLAGALFMVVSWIDVGKLADVSDHVIGRIGAAEGRMAGEHGVVGSRISYLLAQAGSGCAGVAYDPACGIGEALLRLWQASPASNRLQLAGVDVTWESVLLAKQRCFLYGAEATFERADVLKRDPHPRLRADVVVAEPPLGLAMPSGFSLTDSRWALAGPPPKKNADSAWLQHAIAHLSPTGRGLVVTGVGSTSAGSSAHIRRALVRSRCVEAVIALPPKMLLHTSIPTMLWVLRSAEAPQPADDVVFVDVSDRDPTDSFSIQTWLSQSEKRIAVEDLLDHEQVNLDPRHWTQTTVDVGQITEHYHRAAADLSDALEFLSGNRDLTFERAVPDSHTVSVRTLEQQGALEITQARRGADADHTQAGDVLVTIKRTVRAVVDDHGGSARVPGAIRIRVDPGQLDPHYFAECLAASWNQRFEAGSSKPHAGLRDLDIPLLPLDEQARLMHEIDCARRMSAAAQRISAASEAMSAARLEAIRFNVELI
jgi:hypothetical protein